MAVLVVSVRKKQIAGIYCMV